MTYFPGNMTPITLIYINPMNTTKYKQLPHSLKDMDVHKREVAFYFNTFKEADSENDRFFPGSSTKTVAENFNRIKHLYNHWSTVGKPISIQEDDFGTFMVSKIGRDTESNNVLLKYEDGLITEHSFGFQTVKSQGNTEGGKDIFEYKLWEASSLDKWGAQPLTPLISLKAIENIPVQEWVDRLTRLRAAVRKGYTDEQVQEFELQITKITDLLLLAQVATEPGPSATTQPEPIMSRVAKLLQEKK